MPAIRDWTFNYTTSTTGVTIVATMPDYQQDDLLLAIITADTYDATGGFTAALNSGWTVLFAVTNTVYATVLYKIAGASESDPTFTSSDSETYNVHLLAIRDVNTSSPFNGTGGAGTGYRTASNSAARTAMPVLTTTVANSLILYLNAESGAVVPGVLEGACIFEDATDGSAHSDGFSWGFMPSTGAIPTVYSNKSGTAAGLLATIGISAPAAGATVIPAYCAADASIYVDPIHGVTAYNGNTAFAATITTDYGVTINSRTLANGTAAAAADVGVNSFHSMGQITGVTTANYIAGGSLQLASGNKPNASGKNIICHVKPSTPKILQNTNPVTKGGTFPKGLYFGIASSANNFKIWHIHGAHTAWDSAAHLPIVINDGNATGLQQTTGSLNAASVSSFGLAVSGFLVATVWQFGSLWVLDTTTVCGGNASEPLDVAGITKICATGKERMSVLQQGASQALILQPIQIGDGGTSPVYLVLDGTAIEFPKQYDQSAKQVFYCSVDNVAGIIYYPGASDIIQHKNSVVSSKSRFKWGLHASASTSAAYDFSGLAVIGAGTITLANAITIIGLTINDYSTLDVTGLNLDASTILNVPIGNDSLTSSTATFIENCDIDVSLVTAGNRWCTVTTPVRFENNDFTGGGGHAIRITTAGTYTFVGNVFTGFGADGSTGAAILNDSGGAVTLNISGGGNTPTVKNGSGASTTVNNGKTLTLTGLVSGSDIVIRTHGSTTILASADQNSGTTYAYPYTYAAGTYVDIEVYMPGYIPWSLWNYLLTNSDASLPISQVVDPSYVP